MVGDATLGFGRDTALGKHQTHTTPTTNRENDAHMNTGRGGSIDVLTLGEQARGTGTETYENEPSKDRPQNCEWCGKGFKQVAKHRWSCKLRLQGGPLTGKTADIPVDAVTTGRDQLRKSERKSCQDSTHSAVTTEACLASFSIKDYWRKRSLEDQLSAKLRLTDITPGSTWTVIGITCFKSWQVYLMLRTQHTPLYVQFPLTRNLNRRSNQEEMDLHQGLTEYRTSSTRGVQS